MNGAVFAIGAIAVGVFMFAINMFKDGEDGAGLFVLLLAAGLTWAAYNCLDTPESLAKDAEKAKAKEAQRVAEVTPRKVSEADGCTVYAFKPQDRWLYFTKCAGAETTTNNQWTVTTRSGKTTSSHEETMEIKAK